MSFSRVYSAQTHGLSGTIISVETDLNRGLYSFSIVGLPDKAVEEARDRVGAALKNSGFASPKSKNQKVVISLSPADIKKEGSYFDVAIAVGYLLSSEEIEFDPKGKMFLGELSLNGELKPIKGTLPLVQEAQKRGFTEVYVPEENAEEAALIQGITIYGAGTFHEIVEHINTKKGAVQKKLTARETTKINADDFIPGIDFSDIKGQEGAKRGLEIAAAGGHNILMYGPPGTGKTMLAKAFAGILPPITRDEILEITGIHSVAGTLTEGVMPHPPFRSPHHTSSYVAVIGGGVFPKPGEVTLAHRGVLFLDEFPEFEKRVIESLRQPLEDHIVSISRAKGSLSFPSNFILVAAMNPCPCGYAGSKIKQCICTAADLARYNRKMSGPILDRIDIAVSVGPVEYSRLNDATKDGDESRVIRDRIEKARIIQRKRFERALYREKLNSEMNVKHITEMIPLSKEVQEILENSARQLNLSARAYHRVMKIARTIADLDNKEQVEVPHILEAIQYRPRITT